MIFDFYPRVTVITPYPVVIGGRTVFLARGRNDLDVTPEHLRAALQPAGLAGAVRPVPERRQGDPAPEVPVEPVDAPAAEAPAPTPPEPSDAPVAPASKPGRPPRRRTGDA